MNRKKMLSITLVVLGVIMLLIALFLIRAITGYDPGDPYPTTLALQAETVRTGLIFASVVVIVLGAALVFLGFKQDAPEQLERAREEGEGAKSGKKSILRRIGSALIVIAVGTFLINVFIPTSSSYVFFHTSHEQFLLKPVSIL